MKRYGLWFLVVSMVFTMVFAACAAPKTSAPTPSPAPAPTTGVAPTPTSNLTREQQLIEGAKKEGVVNFWTYSIEAVDVALKPFRDKYPFIKVNVNEARVGPTITQLVEERKAGRAMSADVFMMGVNDMFYFTDAGFLAEYEFPNTKGWPLQPNHNYFRNVAYGAGYTVPYNTNIVPPARVPKTWDAFLDPWWKGQVIMSLSADDTPLNYAYMWGDGKTLDWDKSFKYWSAVIANVKPAVATGFTAPLTRVIAGEFATCLPSSSRGVILGLQGAPLSTAPLDAITSMRTISLAKGAPHPNAAKLFIDLYTTPEANLTYFDASLSVPLAPEVVSKSTIGKYYTGMGIKLISVPDGFNTAESLKKSSDWWMKALGAK